jgi:N-acetylmuramoyl-L-alanine amidase
MALLVACAGCGESRGAVVEGPGSGVSDLFSRDLENPLLGAPASPTLPAILDLRDRDVEAPDQTRARTDRGASEHSLVSLVRTYPGRDAVRVVLVSSTESEFRLEASEGSSEVKLRLLGTRYEGPGSVDVGGLVDRAAIAQDGDDVVLSVASPKGTEPRAFATTEPHRVILDIARARAPRTSRGVDSERRVRRVVLDPGHGGHDPGATSSGGLEEKTVVLDIAHRTAALLARELGITTLLTRDADRFVPLEERTARANAFGADLFVSIHCNANHLPGSRGVMTFVLNPADETAHARVAARENRGTVAASNEVARTASRVVDVSTAKESHRFASLLQRSSRASLAQGYSDVPMLGVEKAGFFVLAGARMPSVLFETSFLSNRRDAKYLASEAYRQKVADAIVNAVRAYRRGL